ncbi:type II and III secretion system protein family protein [Stenotrophomonas sp. 24(2023)]|uniref:type II and III secretion system protein family protein n=1 Tax=Stenotrophomonas sp. 24(2023) TaxID=3068324 RepID=UPI0027E07EA7|nr:type II and III secretion system protein family protein [Stenotrophomonas sp. 24(2023)]WMJ69492.1 type II and III secretion system protein family protein [Stenotrophomonas sp. 24(2023)]
MSEPRPTAPGSATRRFGWRLVLLLVLLPGTALQAADELVLQTREQRPWTLPANLERVAIADPAVADIVMLRGQRQALLVGKAPGSTTLLLWHHKQAEPQRLLVRVRSAVQGAADSAGSGLQFTQQDQQGLLQGTTPTALEHIQAQKAATMALGDKGQLADTSQISSGGVVQVEVKVVEFNKTALRQVGVSFGNNNGGFSYGLVRPGGNFPGYTGVLPGMKTPQGENEKESPVSSAFRLLFGSTKGRWNADVELLQSNGLARVLAEPTLVALSGQSASFLAGGELPILEPQGLGTTTVTFKPFGIGLTVTPTVLGPDRIALKVAPEASDLDYSNTLSYNGVQIPSISTRRADTTVELGDGESFVIGGLVSSTVASTVNKMPLLGDLPIIGTFFRNLDYKRQDKELVIIVTPRLVQPLARNTELPLPGEREAKPNLPEWGAWLIGPAGPDVLPGFSR